jgi:hypothetical protein
MNNFWDPLRLITLSIWFKLFSRVEDCKFFHGLSIRYEVIHRFQHCISVFLESIEIDLFLVDLVLGWSVDEHFIVKVDSEGNIEKMARLFYEPFNAVGMLVWVAIAAYFPTDGHIDEYF